MTILFVKFAESGFTLASSTGRGLAHTVQQKSFDPVQGLGSTELRQWASGWGLVDHRDGPFHHLCGIVVVERNYASIQCKSTCQSKLQNPKKSSKSTPRLPRSKISPPVEDADQTAAGARLLCGLWLESIIANRHSTAERARLRDLEIPKLLGLVRTDESNSMALPGLCRLRAI